MGFRNLQEKLEKVDFWPKINKKLTEMKLVHFLNKPITKLSKIGHYKGEIISKANYLVLKTSKKTHEIFAKILPWLISRAETFCSFDGSIENK